MNRFIEAQQHTYEQAISEIRSGVKRTHWMWFIYPQFAGLGSSAVAVNFSVKSVEEAGAYLRHPILGGRLRECAEAVLAIQGKSAKEIFGTPDDLKLRSCATLFANVSPPQSVFERIIEKYYRGESDEVTMRLLASS